MPTLSGREVLKILERKGFSMRYGKGDHIVVEKEGIAPFVVPLKKELKKGTLNHIIKQSGDFNKEKFFELLH